MAQAHAFVCVSVCVFESEASEASLRECILSDDARVASQVSMQLCERNGARCVCVRVWVGGWVCVM